MIIVDTIRLCLCTDTLFAQAVLCQQNVARALRRTLHNMRIGIYSGTFDPIHKGHIAFALEAAQTAHLDAIYFAPETKPRRKESATHIAHRVAMIRLAVRQHPTLDLIELPDASFEPRKTFARLRALFPNDDLVLLIGEDVLEHMHTWPHINQLLPHIDLVIGCREKHTEVSLIALIAALPVQPKKYFFVKTAYANVASMKIRQDIIKNNKNPDLLQTVARYAHEEWLYHDLSKVTQ